MNEIAPALPASPLLDHCPPSLPAGWYFDPAHHEIELRKIWACNWIYAGRENDLAPMTIRRLSVAGQNLILVKDPTGGLSCFHNTCRHRGAELCSADQTRLKSRLITCPYHEWAYDLQGNLVRTPYVAPAADFNKRDHGLLKVHVRAWNGFVFVCLADDPPDFAKAPDVGFDALDNWPMADLVTGHSLVTEIACNWKIFWENYNECLHCPGIHPELCDMVPVYGRGYMEPREAPDWTPETPAPASALKPGAQTWTISGTPCGPAFPGLSPAQKAAGHTFVTLMPTMYVVAHVDYVRVVSLRPTRPDRTELRAQWLFPADTINAPDFNLANVTGFAEKVMRQDGAACEMNQRGLKAQSFAHGRLMPQEFDVFNFQKWVRRHLD